MKIYLDPGHGGSDPGASGNGLLEKDVTLAIALKINDILLKEYAGAETRLSRTTDKTVTLQERTDDANSWGADLFVSIHTNAFDGTAYGYEDYIYSGLSDESVTALYQRIIHGEVIKPERTQGQGNEKGELSCSSGNSDARRFNGERLYRSPRRFGKNEKRRLDRTDCAGTCKWHRALPRPDAARIPLV